MPTYTVTGPTKSDLTLNKSGVRVYTKEYLIESTVINDGALDILGQSPHAYYSVHPSDPIARLKEMKVAQTADLNFWTLTLMWDSEPLQQDRGTMNSGGGDHPTDPGTNNSLTAPNLRPWVFKWGQVTRQKIAILDLATGNEIRNSAGQPFDPPVEVPSPHPTLHITAFTLLDLRGNIEAYVGKVCDATGFLDWGQGKVLCTDYTATSVHDNGLWFWEIGMAFEFNPDGWNPVNVLDRGTYVIRQPWLDDGHIAGGALLTKIQKPVDRNGGFVDGPVLLDGTGGQLKAFKDDGITPSDPVYLPFTVYAEIGFGGLMEP